MEERKIIVNKCDVSGCEFYCRYTDNCLDYKHWYDKPLCKNLPDCHYKQLKRKEQECERLKNERTVDLVKQLDQLKAENERLEAHSATLDAVIETGRIQYKALKQTLTEIKEIAKNGCYDDCGMPLDELSIILQKISECEVDDADKT